jgi:hypothetical protein
MIISCRFIEDANIDNNGDIKDVRKAAMDLKCFINLCEEELKKILEDKDSEDHAWLKVKSNNQDDQNSVKANNKDAEKKITKRLEIAKIFYELFTQASTNTTGKEMNLNEVQKEVIENAFSWMKELLLVKENDIGEEYLAAISKSAHAILKKMDDIQKKRESNDGQNSESSKYEDESNDDHSWHIKGYSNNRYSDKNIKRSVQDTVANRIADHKQQGLETLKKGVKSKSVSGTR